MRKCILVGMHLKHFEYGSKYSQNYASALFHHFAALLLIFPRTLYFEVSCPPDTLLRSKLSPGHLTAKQTVPSQGGQSTWRGVTLLRSKVSGADSLLRSNLPLGDTSLREASYFVTFRNQTKPRVKFKPETLYIGNLRNTWTYLIPFASHPTEGHN